MSYIENGDILYKVFDAWNLFERFDVQHMSDQQNTPTTICLKFNDLL
jgi:hypothetical protein